HRMAAVALGRIWRPRAAASFREASSHVASSVLRLVSPPLDPATTLQREGHLLCAVYDAKGDFADSPARWANRIFGGQLLLLTKRNPSWRRVNMEEQVQQQLLSRIEASPAWAFERTHVAQFASPR